MTGFHSARLLEPFFRSVLLLSALLVCVVSSSPGDAQAAPHMSFVHLKTAPTTEQSTALPAASVDLFAEDARLHLQARGIETVVAFADSDDAEQTLRNAAEQQPEILVVTDPRLFDAAHRTALAFPATLFFVRTDAPVPDFMSGYQARTYEACYLAGVEAAKRLRNESAPELRLFAPDTEPGGTTAETYRNRNAFALGLRSILPDARLILTRTADAVSLEALMTQTVLNWRNVFASVLAQRRFGIWQTGRTIWYGMGSGVIKVASDADATISTTAAALADKPVFSGPLHDNSGQLRVPKGKTLSDAQLATLDWYVAGIID